MVEMEMGLIVTIIGSGMRYFFVLQPEIATGLLLQGRIQQQNREALNSQYRFFLTTSTLCLDYMQH